MTERFESFVSLINALHKEIERIKAAEGARLGLSAGDVMCVYTLLKEPAGMTSAELARAADVSRPAMSRTVARLVEKGFVEVGETGDNNRYRALVHLTEQGLQATRPAGDIVRRVVRDAGVTLDPESRATLYRGLESILEQLKTIGR